MLAKLLKYDFAALSRVLIPVHLATVAVGLLALACFGVFRLVDGSSAAASFEPFAAMTFAGGGICTLALGAAPVATFVIIVRRWYANLFTDEGYLTLTLPVSAGAHVASKTIAGFVWMVVDLALLFVVFVGVVSVLSGNLMVVYGSFFAGNTFDILGTWGRTALQVASGLAQLLALVLLAYVSFALGAVVATRHRVAVGIGIFVGVSWAIGLATSFASVASTFMIYRDSYASALWFPPPAITLITSIIGIVIWLAVSAGLFAWCTYLLKNKVNLS